MKDHDNDDHKYDPGENNENQNDNDNEALGDGTSWDPVKTYLRSVGSIELLTREEEVEIAKQIEEAQDQAIGVIWSLKLGRDTFKQLLNQLKVMVLIIFLDGVLVEY